MSVFLDRIEAMDSDEQDREFAHVVPDEIWARWFRLGFDTGTSYGLPIYVRADSAESAIEIAIDYADRPNGPAGIFWAHSAEDRAEYGEPDGWTVGHTTLENFDYAAGDPFVQVATIDEIDGGEIGAHIAQSLVRQICAADKSADLGRVMHACSELADILASIREDE